ncbi:fungal-specific transcription factor domain-containing protein [Phaeosphaeria sp. MPI-PUGE-AT-0046c]|nr:fungal-specific transcription factor domain-containing protein [Phaeosphaeria sp. MPI-PUGE-AT-0046c]
MAFFDTNVPASPRGRHPSHTPSSPMDVINPPKTWTDSTIPSCDSCRKRKLKCTREQPCCVNCEKFGVACVYEYDRKKPGFKVGAVEGLSRRLEAIERKLDIGQGSELASMRPSSHSPANASQPEVHHESLAPMVDALSSLTKELQNMSSQIATSHGLHHGLDKHLQRKRQRFEVDDTQPMRITSPTYEPSNTSTDDLTIRLWDEIFDAYFKYVHPWISILHQPSIRKGFQQVPRRRPFPRLVCAMMVAALRFVKSKDQPLSNQELMEQTKIAKQEALLSATDEISIENTQILLILSYTEIADDNAHKAFSLLGIAARHVDFLQLYMEDPLQTQNCPVGVLGHSHKSTTVLDWIEEEESRRLFWNTVMLDRLCSTVLGCKSHFSDMRIRRRLPACASFWGTNQPQLTPYLQTFDASSSNPRSSGTTFSSPNMQISPNSEEADKGSTSGIGALAFYVEAVESLATIESHFLRKSVSYTDNNDISCWLMRFKEMDAYLMRWKLRLPQQWKDSGMSRKVLPGVMDPAMTAANAIHNTCLILLHERIAYPDPNLHWVQLPSLDSAEICVRAATEVSTILRKFVEQQKEPHAFSPQLGLCAFVGARSLLIHWQRFRSPLVPTFWQLLSTLDTMATRWATRKELQPKSLFSRFASRLRTIHATYRFDITSCVNTLEPLYTYVPPKRTLHVRHWVSTSDLAASIEQGRLDGNFSLRARGTELDSPEDTISRDGHEGSHKQNDTYTPQLDAQWTDMHISQDGGPGQDQDYSDLIAISQSLLDPNFAVVDRIINFDEIMMGDQTEPWGMG